jgi:hypothetical protein
MEFPELKDHIIMMVNGMALVVIREAIVHFISGGSPVQCGELERLKANHYLILGHAAPEHLKIA